MGKYEKYSTYGTNKDVCNEKQTFCPYKQSIGNLFCVLNDTSIDKKTEDISGAITNTKPGDMITPEIFQQIKNLLQEVHDYGAAGKRERPKQEDINNITIPKGASVALKDKDLKELTVEYYNQVLDAIEVSSDSDLRKKVNDIVKSNDFISQLGEAIKTYKIDEDRCNVCNTNKNCGQYVPKPTTPTTPTRTCIFFQFFFFGGGDSGSGDSGDGCGCSGQCLHEMGSSSPCSTCEIGNNYGTFNG